MLKYLLKYYKILNLLKTNQSLNMGKTLYVDYKIGKNGTPIRVFSSFFVNLGEIYVSIKSVFKVCNANLSDFNVELLQKPKRVVDR